MDTLCRYLIHGNGHSCWFDKSFSAYVFKNGRVRCCCLHFCTEYLFWLFVFLLILVAWLISFTLYTNSKYSIFPIGLNPLVHLPNITMTQQPSPTKLTDLFTDTAAILNELDLRSIVGCPWGMSMIRYTRSVFRRAFRANFSLRFP